MNLIKPESLKKGDTIGILSTSGVIEDREAVLRAKSFLETLGYNVLLSDKIFDECRYLAGKDEDKIAEIHSFFKNPKIKAIVCARGGYGTIRLIKDLDYNLIRNNPKIFCGYSDVTALSLMLLKHSGLITYSGPVAQGDFGAEFPNNYTISSFLKAVTSEELFYGIDYTGENIKGILWGGNLATIVSLCGQDFLPDNDFIFFTEDLNEPVYKIDKMFTQLFNMEKFRKNVKAIVVGDFIDVDNQLWFEDLLNEISNKYNLPVAKGLKATHNTEKDTFPIGFTAELSNGKLSCFFDN